MQLGTFAPKEMGEGDRIKAQDLAGEPLIVVVNEVRQNFKSAFAPDGGTALFVDIANVRTDETYISVLWMNRQIVDQLSDYVGSPLPIKISWTPSQKGGNPFLMPEPLQGNELQMAMTWASKNDGRFERELELRKEKGNKSDSTMVPQSTQVTQQLLNVAPNNAPVNPPVQLVPPPVPENAPTLQPMKNPVEESAAPVASGGIEVTPEMIAAVQALQAQQKQ